VPENTSGGEKTEQPTPKRLTDARDEGQVCMSSEVNIAGLLLVGFCTLAVMAPQFWNAMSGVMRYALYEALNWDLSDHQSLRALSIEIGMALKWLVPFFAVMFLTGLALCTAQVGVHISLKPLMPKLSRISPMTGFGRLFGMRGLMRLVVNLCKLTLVLLVSYYVIADDLPRIMGMKGDVGERLAHDAWLIFALVIKLVAVLLIIAAADYIYQRIQFIRDLMMTKQEVKDEMKQAEGDPHIKGRIRKLQREMARRRMMQEVPKADVVITNPTHVAVALKYDRLKMFAPVVVAKGYDEVAQRIKELAREHDIVQVENITLARALAKEVDIGKAIPTKWYMAVAEVLTLVYKLKKKVG
jgi:flagellar biosynthetic protein FlhB